MTTLLREVQAADKLGYQEMAAFRAAVRSGDVPGPCRKLKVGRRQVEVWSSREIDEWIDNLEQRRVDRRSLDDAIGELAG